MHNPFIEKPFKELRESAEPDVKPAPTRQQRRAAARWAETQRRKAERRAKL